MDSTPQNNGSRAPPDRKAFGSTTLATRAVASAGVDPSPRNVQTRRSTRATSFALNFGVNLTGAVLRSAELPWDDRIIPHCQLQTTWGQCKTYVCVFQPNVVSG